MAKRLFIDNPNDIRLDFRELRNTLEADIAAEMGRDKDRVSLYFEYLPTGVAININPELEAVAASLMKTAVVMQLYKLVESGQVSMDDTMTITDDMLDSSYGQLYKDAATLR